MIKEINGLDKVLRHVTTYDRIMDFRGCLLLNNNCGGDDARLDAGRCCGGGSYPTD
jgi:hypothetical protein